MKTSIKTLITLAVTAVVLTTSTAATFAADGNKETILTTVKKVNKINVSGNVELILVQSTDESVKVYDDYYAKNALVQQKDGVLRISSFNKETLTVVVYVNNLTEINASDKVSVKTFGKFNALALDVNLKDQATANLNMNTVSLSTSVTGDANLTLSGSTEDYTSSMGGFAKVNTAQFNAQTTSIQSKNTVVASVVAPAQLPDAE
jgi:hypothetical protein